MMRALTVWQPWASLIMAGAKPYEFRKWDYRDRHRDLVDQRIVIHAAARPIKPAEVEDIAQRIHDDETSLDHEIAQKLIDRLRQAYKCQGVLELGAGLGTAVLGRPRRVGALFSGKGHDSSRLNHHLWAWPLSDIEQFDEPVHREGKQGFWHWRPVLPHVRYDD